MQNLCNKENSFEHLHFQNDVLTANSFFIISVQIELIFVSQKNKSVMVNMM